MGHIYDEKTQFIIVLVIKLSICITTLNFVVRVMYQYCQQMALTYHKIYKPYKANA